MTSGDVAALITALGIAIGATITAVSALMNARANKHAQDDLKEAFDGATKRIEELEKHRMTDRRDIILMGESLAQSRSDVTIMAEAFNLIWREFNQVTGHRPTADLDMLKRLQTIQYITGKLEPLNTK